jgi:hypothetical protein
VILFFDGFYASFATLASSRILSTAFQLVQTTCVAFLPSWATSQSTLYGSHVGGPDFLWIEHLFCIYGTVEIFVSSLQLTAESSRRQLAEGLRRHHRPRNGTSARASCCSSTSAASCSGSTAFLPSVHCARRSHPPLS